MPKIQLGLGQVNRGLDLPRSTLCVRQDCLKTGLRTEYPQRGMASQLLLVRHANIAPQYAGRYVGSTDVPAEPHGLQQARELAKLVRSRRLGRCFCSPLVRARQTAEVICESTDLRTQVDDDLREVDFGQWEGKTFDEIAAEDPETVDRWADFSEDFAFPGGESVGGFLARIRRAARRLAEDSAGVVLAVTHAGVNGADGSWLCQRPCGNQRVITIERCPGCRCGHGRGRRLEFLGRRRQDCLEACRRWHTKHGCRTCHVPRASGPSR